MEDKLIKPLQVLAIVRENSFTFKTRIIEVYSNEIHYYNFDYGDLNLEIEKDAGYYYMEIFLPASATDSDIQLLKSRIIDTFESFFERKSEKINKTLSMLKNEKTKL